MARLNFFDGRRVWPALVMGSLALSVWLTPARVAPAARFAPPPQIVSGQAYYLQAGTPAAIPNFVQPDAGCNWSGVGGQVFDAYGQPAGSLVLHLSGQFDGASISRYAVSGSSQQFGSGGFDIYLTDHTAASQSLTLQLLDLTGVQLSAPVALTTYDDCQQALLVVNFRAVSTANQTYLPYMRK